jgi:tetratricopeptide (TPR) repeat protein
MQRFLCGYHTNALMLGVLTTILSASKLLSAVPTEDQTDKEWSEFLSESGHLYQEGRIRDATRALEKAVHCAERFKPLDPRLPQTLHTLASLYRIQSNYEAATALFVQAIALYEKAGPMQHDAMLHSEDDLIATFMQAHNTRAAKKLLARRLPESERSVKTVLDQIALLGMRATMAETERRHAESEQLLREALALLGQYYPEDYKDFVTASLNLSEVLFNAKRYQDSLDTVLRAIATSEKAGDVLGPLLVVSLDFAGYVCFELHRFAESADYYARALDTSKRVFGPGVFSVAQVMLHYSNALRALKRNSEAATIALEAETLIGFTGASVDVLQWRPMR